MSGRIGLFLIAMIVIGAYLVLPSSWFHLGENQSLYLFSTMAQVVAGLFGLTLTAYVFFADRLRNLAQEVDSYYEAVDTLLTRSFRRLIFISVICWSTFLCSVVGIISLSYGVAYARIMKHTVVFFFASITLVLCFGVTMLDPNKLTKEATRQKQEVQHRYQLVGYEKSNNLSSFLKVYNKLEQLIVDFGEALTGVEGRYHKGNRPRFLDSLNVLVKSEIVLIELLADVNSLRRYRNGLVHGTDHVVSPAMFRRLKEIYEKLEGVYNVFLDNGRTIPDTVEWKESIRKLNE